MARVIVMDETTSNPITMMGEMAGVCWGADTHDNEKNYARGLDCLNSGHGRVSEFPQVYLILDGYSARVIREFYTHIAGGPTRLQASTRYIDYETKGFNMIIPKTIEKNPDCLEVVLNWQHYTEEVLSFLASHKIPKEDSANLLPLGMETKVVFRTNLRHLIDMSHTRMCNRAYWEFRELFSDISNYLSLYSNEWEYVVKNYFKPKCDLTGYCEEKNSCNRKPKKDL